MPGPSSPLEPSPSPRLDAVPARLDAVRRRLEASCRDVGRDPADVRLMLATKTQPAAVVRAAIEAGATLVGENRVQELVAKGPDVVGLGADLHLIGHLQSNKVNAALRWATCVQSVDDPALAARLSRRCEILGRELEIMVQVNVSGEHTKHGVRPQDALGLAREVGALPRLRLTGFMTIGARSADPEMVGAGFSALRRIRDEAVTSGDEHLAGAHELSMGMSGDLEIAVAEGATIVRVGSAVFGDRPG